jgi:hypothetical protein
MMTGQGDGVPRFTCKMQRVPKNPRKLGSYHQGCPSTTAKSVLSDKYWQNPSQIPSVVAEVTNPGKARKVQIIATAMRLRC